MSAAFDTIDSVDSLRASELEPETLAVEKSDEPVTLTCDLADSEAFYAGRSSPHVPVLAAFGSDPLHAHELRGEWDLDRAVAEHSATLVRSIRHRSEQTTQQWDDLTFRFGPRAFLCADLSRVVGFAGTAAAAEQMVADFDRVYRKTSPSIGGSFHLIVKQRSCIDCENVSLGAETVLPDEALARHYRPGTVVWHRDFTRLLRERPHGLSILEGAPGTGKTSYLRHLMGTLHQSHRFYFIPTSTLDILSQPEFISFWSSERKTHAERRFVVILEDADGALMTRESDNRDQVSAILNLSDGMLADFLRLQIICTINCAAADIDPALLRPGRLLSHHVFHRLERDQAARLAASLGKSLPPGEDFSLAEVFAGQSPAPMNRPSVGFAA